MLEDLLARPFSQGNRKLAQRTVLHLEQLEERCCPAGLDYWTDGSGDHKSLSG